ncbi:MAG: S24 family peptidase [Patescibacteria group bacterium]|nr:S24 family peptidase [Patescibacteria group bacterium]
MNENQQKILKLALKEDISKLTPMEIARKTGIDHVFKVQYHMDQLRKKGLLYFNKKDKKSEVAKSGSFVIDKLLRIPIVGAANCGPATELAHENIEGYLSVSKEFLPKADQNSLMAVRAVGESLNKAKIDGESVESGDYVIVDCNRTPEPGDYVLSVIDDAANFKKFYKTGDEVRLVSESTLDIPPIVLHKKDLDSIGYAVNGVAIKVFKK